MNEFKISFPAARVNAEMRQDDVANRLNQQALEAIGYLKKKCLHRYTGCQVLYGKIKCVNLDTGSTDKPHSSRNRCSLGYFIK